MNGLDFPKWLQDQLNSKGWRPTDLAKAARISDAAVSRILRGERKPDPETLKAFAKALKLPVEQVLRAAGQLPENVDDDPWVEEMAHKLSLLSPSMRGVVARFIDSLIEGEESKPVRTKPNHKPAKA